MGVRRRARPGAAGASRSTPGHDDGRWVFTGDTSKVSGQDQGDPGHPDHGDGRGARPTLRVLPKGAPRAGDGSRSSTRRCASAGTTTASACCCRATCKGAEAAFLKVTRDGARLRRRLGQRRPRARCRRATWRRPRRCCARRSRSIPSSPRRTSSSAPRSSSSGRYDEALDAPAHGRRRSTRATAWCATRSAALLFLKRQYQRGDRRAAAGARDRSRGPAGALQSDARLPGARRHRRWRREHEALYRRFKADESAQAITGPYRQLHPDDNNERQPIHEHRLAPAPAPQAAPGYRAAGAASRGAAPVAAVRT